MSLTNGWPASYHQRREYAPNFVRSQEPLLMVSFRAKYHLFVTGTLKDQTCTMINWPPNAQGPSPTLEGLSLLENGLMVCAARMREQCGDADKKDDPVEWTFNPLPGEVIRSTLISQDQKTKLFFAIVPDPVEKNDNGCTLEAIRLTQKNELLLVRAKGFQPNEDLVFQSESYDEKRCGHAKADAQGEYFAGLMPFVKDKKRGTTEITLKGAKCAPALAFEWGE